MGEFELIKRYFLASASSTTGVVDLGIGDDCALLNNLPTNEQWAISTDLFIEGRHFFSGISPFDIAYKALAVNLSDLAAMGAKPVAFTLGLSLPNSDESFLQEFSRGLFALANQAHCQLIGGDTTRGPLTICITVFGSVPKGQALRRDGAKIGDDVWVSGSLGAAAWAVQEQYAQRIVKNRSAENKLLRPEPRVALGLALRGLASSALDLSDGLSGDLLHIAQRSNVAFEIECSHLPVAIEVRHLPISQQLQLACAGGDDYELAFTAAPKTRETITKISESLDLPLTRVGRVVDRALSADSLLFFDHAGSAIDPKIVAQWQSFQHFS